jgi:hypothetical protein
MPLGVGRVLSLGLAVLLGGWACGAREVCNVECSGGAGGPIDQTSLTAPIVSLTVDPSCTVSQTDAGQEIFVDMIRTIDPPTSGSCKVHATLTDGSTWVAILSWVPSTSQCCGTVTQTISPYPKFARVDGGLSD